MAVRKGATVFIWPVRCWPLILHTATTIWCGWMAIHLYSWATWLTVSGVYLQQPANKVKSTSWWLPSFPYLSYRVSIKKQGKSTVPGHHFAKICTLATQEPPISRRSGTVPCAVSLSKKPKHYFLVVWILPAQHLYTALSMHWSC
jgi:hypothetical protein